VSIQCPSRRTTPRCRHEGQDGSGPERDRSTEALESIGPGVQESQRPSSGLRGPWVPVDARIGSHGPDQRAPRPGCRQHRFPLAAGAGWDYHGRAGTSGIRGHAMPTARILVVDDDRVLRQMVRDLLEGAVFAVAEAVDGADGVTQAAALQPDLILLDLMMPNVDGYTACSRLKAPGHPDVSRHRPDGECRRGAEPPRLCPRGGGVSHEALPLGGPRGRGPDDAPRGGPPGEAQRGLRGPGAAATTI